MLHFPTSLPINASHPRPKPQIGGGFCQRPIHCCWDLFARAKEVVPFIDEGKFILKLVDMALTGVSHPRATKFWADVNVHQFPNVKKVAVIVLSMFGSTYTCESSFSHMNSIKISYCCSLTDNTLHQCLRIALTSYEPKVTALVQNKKGN
ncbi:EPM2A-interacting protein 1 [Merluccius polli]|uniref:EPM2A-interacting protein 1 n=1 Tax=Merluccius polli TaxID=89951 RepID=A0AA47NRQ3_MERPO|nr:EPM2A-interacting protein 1 [Merluccius polli]